MKQVVVVFLWVASVAQLSAQKIAGPTELPAAVGHSMDKVIPDTVWFDFFDHNPVLYTAPVGGWMNGTNNYGDVEKAQETKWVQSHILTGFIYWFALKDKNTGGDTSSIIYKLYKKDVAQSANGVMRLVPGTVLASDTVELADINAGTTFDQGLNVFLLPQPIVMYHTYIGAFSMELMNPADEIALYGTTDGEVYITDYSWEKWQGNWNTIKNSWTLDVDFAIFPILDLTGASIHEPTASSVQIFPNPADDHIQVTLTEGTADQYVLLNTAGQTVRKGTASNNSQFQVDLNGLAGGYYLLGVYSGNGENARFFRFLKK